MDNRTSSFSGALNEVLTRPIPDVVHRTLWKTLINVEPALSEHIPNPDVQKIIISCLGGLVGAMDEKGLNEAAMAKLFAITSNMVTITAAAICTKYDLVNKAGLNLE